MPVHRPIYSPKHVPSRKASIYKKTVTVSDVSIVAAVVEDVVATGVVSVALAV